MAPPASASASTPDSGGGGLAGGAGTACVGVAWPTPAPPAAPVAAAPPLPAVRDRGGVAAASSAMSLCLMSVYHRELRGGTDRELPSGRGRQAELLASSRHRILSTIYFEEQNLKCLGVLQCSF